MGIHAGQLCCLKNSYTQTTVLVFYYGYAGGIEIFALRQFVIRCLVPMYNEIVQAILPQNRRKNTMRAIYPAWLCFLTVAVLAPAVVMAGVPVQAADADLAPLPIKLPAPTLKGTPDDLPEGPNIEPLTEKPRPVFLAPIGTRNVALNKRVTSSDRNPIFGEVAQITDGNKEAFDDQVVEMRKGVQWVQIDLREVCDIYALVVWHDHRVLQVFRSVVVQAADDPNFIENVTVLFNNDTENRAGLGIGFDRQYFETLQGKLIQVKDTLRTRYLRFYSKGNNMSALNCYQEIEVYGQPVK